MPSETCDDCRGTGEREDCPCTTCAGSGVVSWGEKDTDGFTPDAYEAGRIAKLERMEREELTRPKKLGGLAVLSAEQRSEVTKRSAATRRAKLALDMELLAKNARDRAAALPMVEVIKAMPIHPRPHQVNMQGRCVAVKRDDGKLFPSMMHAVLEIVGCRSGGEYQRLVRACRDRTDWRGHRWERITVKA
jgi:hypothetical protein